MVRIDEQLNAAHNSTDKIFLGDLKAAQKVLKIWQKYGWNRAAIVPQRLIPKSLSQKAYGDPPPEAEAVIRVYSKLLSDKEVVEECTKGPYPWGQDKDKRIQELLESNNQYLERARKAERELFVTQSFVKNFICQEGGRVFKHARTNDKYVLERDVKIKTETKDGWLEGVLYRSLGPDSRSYVRTLASFNRSFLPVDLETEKD